MKSLQIMSPDFEKISEIAQYESLQITRSYYGTGSFSLSVHPGAKNAEYITPDVIVFFSGEPEKAFLIEDVQQHSRTKMTVKGCMLKGFAKRRVCVPPLSAEAREYQDFGWDRFTGSAEAAYLHFANNNLITPDDAARAIPHLVAATNQDRGTSLPWQARFDKLDTLFQTIGETTGMGWDISLDLENEQFIFSSWEGTDRTQGNGLCLISEENGNASDLTYKAIYSGSASTAYVGGAGEDEERFILSEGGSVSGLSRREIWAEAGSIEDPDLLTLYAKNKLTDTKSKITLTANLIDSGACRYGRDYDVGDLVFLRGRGVQASTRITEIKETYEGNQRSLSGVFGDRPITVESILSRKQNAAR